MRFCFYVAMTLGLVGWQATALGQTTTADLAGTYRGNQMEVGTELRLEANGRFEYYLSYGALDEMSEGTWSLDGEAILLSSDPFRAPAFELVGSKRGKAATLDVSLEAPKQMPLQYFSALILRSDHTTTEGRFDEGHLRIPLTGANRATSFVLGLEIFSVMSEPHDIPPDTRTMHFRFVPNELGKVAFAHKRLPREGEDLLLERYGRMLRFHKERSDDEAENEQTLNSEDK
jgi:hypothetical protein